MEDRERKIYEFVGLVPVRGSKGIDPNFISRYVIPELRKQEYTIEIDIDETASVAIIKEAWHHGGLTVNEMYHAMNKNPLEAFLQALEKLIDRRME